MAINEFKKIDISGKTVDVLQTGSKSKILHKGVVLGCDPFFTDTILVGVTWTSIPGIELKHGRQFISIFKTKRNRLVVK